MTKRDSLVFIGFLVLTYCVGFLGGITHEQKKQTELVTDTTFVTVYDTLVYHQPVARDSVVLRYKMVKLPLVKDTSLAENQAQIIRDSVEVDIPITQKVYSDSTYTAYVSGYNPALDSIHIYQSTHTYTITYTREKVRRWGIGLQVGAGWGRGGVTPYVGVGLSYNLFTF